MDERIDRIRNGVFMNSFNAYEHADTNDVKPDCPTCCKKVSVSLIDVAVDKGETTPVWHCAHCCKVFGTRSFKMESIISGNCYQSYEAGMVTSNISDLQSGMAVMKCDVSLLTDRLAAIEDHMLKMQKKMEDDSLTCLRGRVDGFSLS